jgi:hypothetical protein
MSPLSEMATMPSSILFLLSQQRITPSIHALAHDRGIMLDSVIERLAAPDSASIQIRMRLGARSHKSTTARANGSLVCVISRLMLETLYLGR